MDDDRRGARNRIGRGRAQRKLLASLPRATAESARRTHERLHVDLARWYAPAEMPAHLPALARAVWDMRKLRIEYASWQKRAKREIEPHGLVLKNATWYLVARCDGRLRTYRVSEIAAIQPLDATFLTSNNFNLRAYWESSTRRFERSLVTGEAIVRCTPDALPLLHRIGPGPAQASKDDASIVSLPIESIERAARELLAFGDSVEVLAPAELRERIANAARMTAELYEKKRVPKRGRNRPTKPTR
jgi:predicted DNA-binding transcriptional regulator YafY